MLFWFCVFCQFVAVVGNSTGGVWGRPLAQRMTGMTMIVYRTPITLTVLLSLMFLRQLVADGPSVFANAGASFSSPAVVAAALWGTTSSLCYGWMLQVTSTKNSYLPGATLPLVVMLFGWVAGPVRPTGYDLFTVLAVLLLCLVILWPLTSLGLAAGFLLMVNIVAFGGYIFFLEQSQRKDHVVLANCFGILLIGAPIVHGLRVLNRHNIETFGKVEPYWPRPTRQDLKDLFGLGVVQLGIPFFIGALTMGVIGSMVASLEQTLVIALAPLIATRFAGEKGPGRREWIAIALLIVVVCQWIVVTHS